MVRSVVEPSRNLLSVTILRHWELYSSARNILNLLFFYGNLRLYGYPFVTPVGGIFSSIRKWLSGHIPTGVEPDYKNWGYLQGLLLERPLDTRAPEKRRGI